MPVTKQQGAYTLSTVLTILFIFGLASIFSAQTSIAETRMVNAEAQRHLASQIAQIGLATSLQQLSAETFHSLSSSETQTIASEALSNSSGLAIGSYTSSIQRNSNVDAFVTVEARTADNSSRQRVQQQVNLQPLFHYLPRSAATISGDAVLHPLVTINGLDETPLWWSGGTKHGGFAYRPVTNDQHLRQLNRDSFIANFSTLSLDGLRQALTNIDCTDTCSTSQLDDVGNAFIVGDLNIEHSFGTIESPRLLIVDGNVNIRDRATFTGVLICLNGWNNRTHVGGVRGEVLVWGDVSIDNIFQLSYDSGVVSTVIRNSAFLVPVAGTLIDG
ncbi:MAG: hypothetical protein OEZ43_06285 [Gammaproteobacteria bacterium]|nr:hypothetical protein [Gammaproteobacteria bacterium]